MRLGFLELPADERRLYIEQAAFRRSLSPVILEKDFWVCWLLGNLFESDFADSLVFKGGTSLSKVFGVIGRFSEDLDLSLSPAFLQLPEAGASRNKANKWMTRAEAVCGAAVHHQIGPAMEAAVTAVLGKAERPWFEFLTDPYTHSPVLLFHYPSSQPAGFEYLKRSVKLEFGSLTDQQPVGRHAVRPWIADVLPEAFADWRCEVIALEVERSFWEKATILHTEYHRPADRPTPDRFSRHYADTAALAKHPTASKAIDQHELRQRVVKWKSQFFGQFLGELCPGEARHVSTCSSDAAAAWTAAGLPGDAGHVPHRASHLRGHSGNAGRTGEASQWYRRRLVCLVSGKRLRRR